MEGPETPKKKKKSAKKVFAIVAGVIGLLASTSTVVALIWGWFDPEPDVARTVAELKQQQEESLETQKAIEKKLARASEDDGQLVNQVSRQVTRLADEHKRLKRAWSDIQRLATELRKATGKAPAMALQGGLDEAGRDQERKALGQQAKDFRARAERFCASVKEDAALAKVESGDSQAATLKAKAQAQAREVCDTWLGALAKLEQEFKLD